MAKFEFDDEGSRLVEEFNASAGAVKRRTKILEALALNSGDRVLDVGSGPGNQAFEMSQFVGTTGRIDGVDATESAIEIARYRCSELDNVRFQLGDASNLPFNDACMDVVMSSQVFEYLDNVTGALAEIYRVLKPGGRVLIHDTDWGTVLWHSSSTGAILVKAISGYVVSQGISQSEADAWSDDLCALGTSGDYFSSWNEYMFTADKP